MNRSWVAPPSTPVTPGCFSTEKRSWSASLFGLIALSVVGCDDTHACRHVGEEGVLSEAVADISDDVEVPIEPIEHAIWEVSLLAGTSYVQIEAAEASHAHLYLDRSGVLDGFVDEDGAELELGEADDSPLCPQRIVEVRSLEIEAGVSFLRFETSEVLEQWMLLYAEDHDE
jgi:hypothetical protein